MEVFKLATSCANPLNNYMVFNDSNGIYTYAYEAERKEDCVACCNKARPIEMSKEAKLQDFIEKLTSDPSFQMKNPGITTNIDGKNKTLYMPTVKSIEEATRPNLKKSLVELGLESKCELVVADSTSPKPLVFKLIFQQ